MSASLSAVPLSARRRAIPARAWLIGACLVLAALASVLLRPRSYMADTLGPLHLATTIPTAFADWRAEDKATAALVPADVEAALGKLYTEVLERSYVNARGERIMLSIAYGRDQRGTGTQVHRPEFCYAAQGFALTAATETRVPAGPGSLPLRRLVARRGARQEPLSYWVTVGDHATLPGWDRKRAQLREGFAGRIPDGMLVRVSSLGHDPERAWALQARFIADLVAALPPTARARVAGKDAP